MDKTKIAIIAIAVCAAVAIATLSIVTAVANDPMNLVVNSVEKSAEAFRKSDLMKHYDSVLNGGSIEVSGSAESLTESLLGTGLDLDASAKFYFDLENNETAAKVSASIDEEELIAAQLYASEKLIAVMSEALFGEGAYGIDLNKLAENFDNSEFGEDGAYSLGIDSEAVAEYLDASAANEEFAKDAEKIMNDLVKAFAKSFRKHADINKENGTLRIGGEDLKTKDISIYLNGETITLIATDILEYLDENKKLREFLSDNGELIFAPTAEGVDADDMIDDFYDRIDDLLDATDDLSDMVEDIEANITVNIGRSNKQLLGASVDVENDGESIVEVSLVCGPTWKNITEITAKAEVYGEKYSVSYDVDENSSKLLEVGFKLKQGSVNMLDVDFQWDKKDNDFEIEATAYGSDLFTVEGELVVKGKTSTLTLDSVSVDHMVIDLDDSISVIVKESDKIPTIDSCTDIMTMSADELDDLAESVNEALGELAGGIFGLVFQSGGFGGLLNDIPLGGIGGDLFDGNFDIPSDGIFGY